MSHVSFIIYALYDIDSQIRYIGKTNDLWVRFNVHLRTYDWAIGIKVIEWVDESNWSEREVFWIAYYREVSTLVNISNGGNGNNLHSEESKLKISASLKGREFSSEHKSNLSQSNLRRKERFGSHHSSESIEKIRTKKLKNPTKHWEGKKLSESHRENIKKGWIQRKLNQGVK